MQTESEFAKAYETGLNKTKWAVYWKNKQFIRDFALLIWPFASRLECEGANFQLL
jgi:hypothetical protein